MKLSRRQLPALAAAALPLPAAAQTESVLRVAMTLSDIPGLGGQPDQGGEGWRFVGCTLFETLVNWDLSSADKPSRMIPGLAQSWAADAADRRRWVFKLRPGVRFHDGSAFNADSLVWNMQKLMDPQAPQYDARQVAQTYGRMNALARVEKVDELTVAIITKEPDAMVPWYFGRIMMSSPAQWEKVGRSWEAFGRNPSGTGPWKFDRLVPRQRLDLLRNADYWDQARVPKTDRLVLLPIPDANTRVPVAPPASATLFVPQAAMIFIFRGLHLRFVPLKMSFHSALAALAL